jgi:hypothetical protein
MSSEIFFLTRGDISGPSYSEINAYVNAAFTVTTHLGSLAGKTLYVPYYITNDGIFFSNFSSTIQVDGTTTLTTQNYNLTNSSSTQNCMFVVDNASGLIGSGSASGVIDDNSNFFSDNCLKFYSYSSWTLSALAYSSGTYSDLTTYAQAGSDNTKMASVNITPGLTVGNIYSISSFRMPLTGGLPGILASVPVDDYLLPPLAPTKHANYNKQWMTVTLMIEGSGKILVQTYFDGAYNPNNQNIIANTPSQSIVVDLDSVTGMKYRTVNLNGTNGNYMRVRIRGIRGYSKYRLYGASAQYRLKEFQPNVS